MAHQQREYEDQSRRNRGRNQSESYGREAAESWQGGGRGDFQRLDEREKFGPSRSERGRDRQGRSSREQGPGERYGAPSPWGEQERRFGAHERDWREQGGAWRRDRDFGGPERDFGGEERYWQERDRAEDDDLWSSEDYGSYDTDEFERFESPRRRSLGGYSDQHGGYRTGPRSDFPRYFGGPGEFPGYGAERNWPESRGQRELGRFPGGRRQLGRFSGRGPRGYQRADDRVREDVCDRLTDDPDIDASNLTVNVKDGEVTLAGTVDDRQSQRRAEDLAELVPGVKQVHNQLRVQSRSQEDDELARRSTENGEASTRH